MNLPNTKTRVLINLSVPELAERYAQQCCDGVGLMRAEFLALSLGTHPQKLVRDGGADAFVDFFSDGLTRVAKAFYPRPVIYRTLDLKSNEYAGLEGGEAFEKPEANPMLGFRGCSRYREDADSFRLELDAVRWVIESGLDNVKLMLPFVRFPGELESCRAMAEEAGLFDFKGFELWMMAEVPSNILAIDEFLPFVSGVSIGSNDLTQLILGIDRDNERLAAQFDTCDPAVMAGIERIIRGCREQDTTVSICGDAPARHPELVEKLVGLGISSISVPSDALELTIDAVAKAEARLGIGPRDAAEAEQACHT
jgi:pyruvate,water dikinase